MRKYLFKYGFEKKIIFDRGIPIILENLFIFADFITCEFIYGESNVKLKINNNKVTLFNYQEYSMVKYWLDKFLIRTEVKREIKINKILNHE